MMRLFDKTVASRLQRTGFHAVVAYENAALHTFHAARRLGITCILDAASVHHSFQDKWDDDANTSLTRADKDREIELAELVITCSSLARDSYITAGVPKEKVSLVALGVDLSLFRVLAGQTASQPRHNGPIVFCNVGALNHHKGADLIVSACQRLEASGQQFRFVVAGNAAEAESGLLHDLTNVAQVRPRMHQEDLPKFYAAADVFVSPSRFDSFGMVVSEALACGLPVIVTDNVGAKDMVRDGVNGWVIPAGSPQALAERMEWCSKNPSAVRSMGKAARLSAEVRSWTRYRAEVAELVIGFLESGRLAR